MHGRVIVKFVGYSGFDFGLFFMLIGGPAGGTGELIVYQSSRHPSVCAPVNTFKHEYLRNQQADCNQILSDASLGWGIGCMRFLARSDWNSEFHGNG